MEQNSTPGPQLIYGNDCPYIDIQWEKGQLFLSNPVLRMLKNPQSIKFRWNPEKLLLVIQATEIDDPDGFPVIGKTYADYGSLFVGCRTLVICIWPSAEWNKTLKYRIVAKYNAADNIAVFDLLTAEAFEIPRNMRGGRIKRPKTKKKKPQKEIQKND